MKHCTMAKQSWRLALLKYLATPLDCNTPSLSELNGCTFTSLLPNLSKLNNKYSDQLVDRHDVQLQHDKRGHTLPELPVGSKVGYRNHVANKFDVCIISDRDARSYTIYTENDVHVSRNRIDLKCTDAPFELKTRPVVSTASSKHVSPNVCISKVKSTGKADLTAKRVEVSKSNNFTNSMYTTTRSGCISKPATRLITQM